jgi:hypothetical protein
LPVARLELVGVAVGAGEESATGDQHVDMVVACARQVRVPLISRPAAVELDAVDIPVGARVEHGLVGADRHRVVAAAESTAELHAMLGLSVERDLVDVPVAPRKEPPLMRQHVDRVAVAPVEARAPCGRRPVAVQGDRRDRSRAAHVEVAAVAG